MELLAAIDSITDHYGFEVLFEINKMSKLLTSLQVSSGEVATYRNFISADSLWGEFDDQIGVRMDHETLFTDLLNQLITLTGLSKNEVEVIAALLLLSADCVDEDEKPPRPEPVDEAIEKEALGYFISRHFSQAMVLCKQTSTVQKLPPAIQMTAAWATAVTQLPRLMA